jgi:putative sterol carrier protein
LQADFELHLGQIVIHARVDSGKVAVAEGALADPDLVIEAGPGLKDLMNGDLSPREAIMAGSVRLTGPPALLDRFVELFHIPSRPASLA